jgi:hypothetical protein
MEALAVSAAGTPGVPRSFPARIGPSSNPGAIQIDAQGVGAIRGAGVAATSHPECRHRNRLPPRRDPARSEVGGRHEVTGEDAVATALVAVVVGVYLAYLASAQSCWSTPWRGWRSSGWSGDS